MFQNLSLYLIFILSIFSKNEAKGLKIRTTVTVSKDGKGNFSTISDAVAVAPNNSNGADGYFRIKIMEGLYEEYITVDPKKRYLMMIGVGMNRTIITGNHSHVDGWDTMRSATFTASGSYFICMNMTIRNTAGPTKGQAVALLCNGDFSVFYKCSIEGYQDTLYVQSNTQHYRECDVFGTTDFIFGDAAVVLQKCNLYARKPTKGNGNEITAQGRTIPNYKSGIVIQGCTIKPTDDLVRSNYTVKTYLGRPWKNYSRTIVMQTYIDGFLEPAGWDRFAGDFGLKTLYYAEYGNTGPGSNTKNRVTWPGYHIIYANVASKFTVSSFIHGDNWIPQTNVPYVGGLIP